MKIISSLTIVLSVTASTVLADGHHIEERQKLMKGISGQLRIIGQMAQGRTDFDADAAAGAKLALVDYAASFPAVFESDENGPSSESKPEIWSDWDGFMSQINTFSAAANGLDTASLDGLKAGMGALGGTCSGCHKNYRAKK